MKEYFTAAELADLPGLPGTERGIQLKADRDGWQYRDRKGRGGGREFHLDVLPHEAQAELVRRDQAERENAILELTKLPTYKRTRAQARAFVLAELDRQFKGSEDAFETFQKAFADRYNAGQLLVDAEVRQLVPKVSPRTLRRWRAKSKSGIATALADAYGNRAGSGAFERNPVLHELVIGAYVTTPHAQPRRLLEICQVKAPELAKELSVDKIARHLKREWSKNPYLMESFRNPDRAKSKYLTAQGDADQNIHQANQLWELDSTPLDIMIDGGRHAVLGCIDVFSRRLMLWVARTSTAAGIATLLKRAILAWGVPTRTRTDNGQDYASNRVQNALRTLGIDQEFAPPFSGDRKPFIERTLGTFLHDLVELHPDFLGHDVAQAQALRARRSFAQRLGERERMTVSVKCSVEEMQTFCDLWCTERYEHRQHAGLDGATPAQRMVGQTIRRIADERALDMLLSEELQRKVGKKGIQIDGVTYVAAELGAHDGERVVVRRPDDEAARGRIYVFNGAQEFICVAEDKEQLGNLQELAGDAKRQQRENLSEQRAAARRFQRQHIGSGSELAHELLAKTAERNASVRMLKEPAEQPYATEALAGAVEAARAQDELAGQPTPASTEADAPALPILTRAKRQPECSVDVDEYDRDCARYRELRPKQQAGTLTAGEAEELAFLLKYKPGPIMLEKRLDKEESDAREAARQAAEDAIYLARAQARHG